MADDRAGDGGEPEAGGEPGFLARHPLIAGVFVVCALAGAVAGAALLPEEWSLLRRIAAGAAAGAGSALVVTATRLIG